MAVALNQHSLGPQERLLAFIDRNRDLLIAALYAGSPVGGAGPAAAAAGTNAVPIPTYKMHSHVESFAFNDETNVLVGLTDGRLTFWHHPDVAFVDRDLLPSTAVSVDATEYGRGAQILSYTGNRISLRKIDGSVLFTASKPDIPLLYELTRAGKWEEATRLCRHQKNNCLWATLASMSLAKRQLETAEVALAELNEVHSLSQHIND